MKSLLLLVLILTIGVSQSQTLPDCSNIKYYLDIFDSFYGECSKCYNFSGSSLVRFSSFYVNCVTSQFTTYTNPSCDVSSVKSTLDFSPYPQCTSTPCCLMRRWQNEYNRLFPIQQCSSIANVCFGDSGYGAYFKNFNSTTYSFHQTSNCADTQIDTFAQKICTYGSPTTSDATSTTTTTNIMNNFINKSNANSLGENLAGVFSLFVIYLLFV